MSKRGGSGGGVGGVTTSVVDCISPCLGHHIVWLGQQFAVDLAARSLDESRHLHDNLREGGRGGGVIGWFRGGIMR